MVKPVLLAVTLCYAIALTTTSGSAAQTQRPAQEQRFDDLVRADFFAGIAGDNVALERAMRVIEQALASDPRRAEDDRND